MERVQASPRLDFEVYLMLLHEIADDFKMSAERSIEERCEAFIVALVEPLPKFFPIDIFGCALPLLFLLESENCFPYKDFD